MATIYDVAELAGVSTATVSRVLNGSARVTESTMKAVREAADSLAYTPSRTARALRTQNSELVALIIPDIENPFFTSIARGVEDSAQEAGYSVVLCNTDGNLAKEKRYLDIVSLENMAGVILAAASAESEIGAVLAQGRPVIAVDREPIGVEIDAVTLDNRGGARDVSALLLERGFTRVACITGPEDVETARLRADGWRDALRAAGATPRAGHLEHADFRVDGGRAAMERLLALPEPPDAVFVANNLMGVGALRALRGNGRAVGPEASEAGAFGLASFGELPYGASGESGVVEFRIPARRLGAAAMRMLIERIDGDTQRARTVVLRGDIDAEPEALGG